MYCFNLASLDSIELCDNVLRTLPASMSSLVKLRVLDLGNNLLEDLVSLHAYTMFSCHVHAEQLQWGFALVWFLRFLA